MPMKNVFFRCFGALNRSAIIAIEVFAVMALLLAGFFAYVLFELSRGPIDLNFARAYIQDSLSGGNRDVQLTFDHAQASWPDLKGPLMIDLSGLQVWQGGQQLVVVNNLSLAVAKAPLFIGLIRPERLIIREPTLMLERTADRQLHFALSGPINNPSKPEANTEDITKALMGMMFGKERRDFGLFSKISELEIRQARLRIADQPLGMTWQLNDVTLFFREVDVGVYGSVTLRLPGGQNFSTVMTYSRDRDVLSINSTFQNFYLPSILGRLLDVDWLRHQRMPLTGSVMVEAGLETLELTKLQIDAQADHGLLDTMGLLPQPLPVDDISLNLNFDAATRTLMVPGFNFKAGDIPVQVSGSMTGQNDNDYRGDLVAHVATLDLEQVKNYWPEDKKDTALGRWLFLRLSGAVISDVQADFPLRLDREAHKLTMLALRPKVTFAFDKLRADYHAPLYPVENAKGTGTFEGDALSLHVESGAVKDLKLTDTTIDIIDLTKENAGEAKIHVNLEGPVSTTLDYISVPPINLGKKLPIKPAQAKGRGIYVVDVSFPTIKNLPVEDVNVDVNATLNDLLLPELVKGQDLSGGPYALQVADGMIKMKGSGQLAGRPITLDWTQPVHSEGQDTLMAVSATVDSDDAMRKKFGADLAFIQGSAIADVTYTERANGTEVAVVKANLKPARIMFDPVHYEKAPGLDANATVTVNLRKGAIQNATGLQVTAPGLNIKNGQLGFGVVDGAVNLTSAKLPDMVMGDTLATINYQRKSGQMIIDATGKKLDLSPFLSAESEPESGPAINFTAKVDEAKFDKQDSIKNLDLSVVLDGQGDLGQLQMTGLAGGKNAVMRYMPNKDGKMTLNISAQDAGAFLRAMGIYDNMVGGTLSIDGSPIGTNNRDVKGNLLIKDFNVVKAPILAQLLGIMSLSGVGEQLSSKGIGFTQLDSGFAWLRRRNQDLMTFREGRTSGSALGLTFDGIYDRRKKQLEINGTIIPVSGINTFASNIPLVGQLIAGGKGSALFAATYSVKGPAAKPEMSINPLAVLTPGILRRIFFEQKTPRRISNDGNATAPKRKAND